MEATDVAAARLTLRVDFGKDRAVGPGKIRLLEAIRDTGSITKAGVALGMSYRRAWLLVDARILSDARRQLRDETLWFQRLSGHYLLRVSRVRGATVEEVARKAGIDPAGLAATVEKYGSGEDAFGKHPDLVAPLVGPYALIDCSFGPRLGYPCPTLTLGGLKVDEGTGQVVDADGAGVPGLYAAGRNAVGICSNSYVSGLSLADCVFSGRRAGRHAADEVSSEMT